MCCACAGNAGNVFPHRWLQRKPLVSDPGMHHGTCVTHVPWCMSGSLTRGGVENVSGIPGACAPTVLRIWQEAHGSVSFLTIYLLCIIGKLDTCQLGHYVEKYLRNDRIHRLRYFEATLLGSRTTGKYFLSRPFNLQPHLTCELTDEFWRSCGSWQYFIRWIICSQSSYITSYS